MTSPDGGVAPYANPGYVASLSEFGRPRPLPRSGGWVLERPIPRTQLRDAMGPYPLFSCSEWSALAEDVRDLRGALVSLVLVADPLGGAGPTQLRAAFPDHVTVLKQHLVVDTDRAAPLPEHHRRNLRRAGRSVDVEVCEDPCAYLDDWVQLYGELVDRHSITGVRAFSPASFRAQLALPGMVAVRGVSSGVTVSMTLWLVGAHNAYYHLGASSAAGRAVGASFAVFATALDHLRSLGVRLVDLGGGAGAGSPEDGLYRFKRGWANDERPAYLCGRILDTPAYAELSARARPALNWLPAYRGADVDLAPAGGRVGNEGSGA